MLNESKRSCRTQRTKPCADCPFSKHTDPGVIGGAPVQVYLGQIVGPFWLPCHSSKGYDVNRRDPTHEQCAGAAIFRANVGVDVRMPDALLHLPPGDPSVFKGPAEFLEHHLGFNQTEAAAWLAAHPAQEMLAAELRRQGVHDMTGQVKGKPVAG